VHVQATVENPQSRSLHATAQIKDFATGKLQDSVVLHNDGQHSDGLANDSLWGGFFVPTTICVYGVSVRTVDEVTGATWELADAAAFATAGPVKYAGYRHWHYSHDTVFTPGGSYGLHIGLRNLGSTGVIPNATVRVTPVDPLLDVASPAPLDCGTLPPGDTVCYSSDMVVIDLGSDREKGDSVALFALNISTNGFQLWRDTMRIVVHTPTAVAEEQKNLPTCYRLEQNYPNPFNPTTVVSIQLPVASRVKLVVYDILGREVTVLIDERKTPGRYSVDFDGSRLASGIYLLRMSAGSFSDTRKMLLLR
jgi:hypothetical protein